jgi:nitrate/TMAO reductase-like tetraheme cytochrome c subunit
MRKMMLLMLVVLLAVGFAAAQTYSGNSVGGLKGMDVLGAHNNGGRGCAGCHAPHSGAAGGGGNAATNAAAFNDPLSGSNALFGQDVTPLYGQTLTFGGGYVEALPAEAAAYTTNEEELRSIMYCLACHDGQIAKGQMMQGTSWEQSRGILPAGVYGTRGIPTLLGNDNNNGNTSGYGNDHPVGTQATLGRLRLVTTNATTSPLTVVVTNGAISSITPTAGTTYANFAANYGYPAIAGSPWSWGVVLPDGDTNPADAFITCTTCHNQHVMYIYQPPRGKQAGTAIVSQNNASGYPTYFFINAPYNPGTGNTNPTLAASTTQFCRQCHFNEANEAFGVNNVATQF